MMLDRSVIVSVWYRRLGQTEMSFVADANFETDSEHLYISDAPK